MPPVSFTNHPGVRADQSELSVLAVTRLHEAKDSFDTASEFMQHATVQLLAPEAQYTISQKKYKKRDQTPKDDRRGLTLDTHRGEVFDWLRETSDYLINLNHKKCLRQ